MAEGDTADMTGVVDGDVGEIAVFGSVSEGRRDPLRSIVSIM